MRYELFDPKKVEVGDKLMVGDHTVPGEGVTLAEVVVAEENFCAYEIDLGCDALNPSGKIFYDEPIEFVHIKDNFTKFYITTDILMQIAKADDASRPKQ